jgi:hypothetical protein
MPTYTSLDPNVEVIGQNMLSFIQNIQAEAIQPVLEKHGLLNVQPDTWYRLQDWLDVLSDLSTQSGAMFNMVAIGTAISETALIPPEVAAMSLEQFLFIVDNVYQMQHRNGDPGHIQTEQVADKHIKLTVRVPYPDDLEYGTTYGFVRRFLPKGTNFMVEYDPDTPRREQGGDATIIHVTWK